MSATLEKLTDRLANSIDSERPRAAQQEAIADALIEARELAEAWERIADALEASELSCEEWALEEEREPKADAREELLSSYEEVIDAWQALGAVEEAHA